jgi:hypothetical protein
MAKKPVDPLKAKEQRQKKILIGLAPVFLIVLVLTVPKTLHRMHASAAPPPAPPATTPDPTATTTSSSPVPLLGGTTTTTPGGLPAERRTAGIVRPLRKQGSVRGPDPAVGVDDGDADHGIAQGPDWRRQRFDEASRSAELATRTAEPGAHVGRHRCERRQDLGHGRV